MLPTPNAFTGLLALSEVLQDEDLYEVRTINNSQGQVLYVGKCLTPNGSTSAAIWFVKKLGYDGNGFLNRVQLPDNGIGFLYIWDNVQTDYFS